MTEEEEGNDLLDFAKALPDLANEAMEVDEEEGGDLKREGVEIAKDVEDLKKATTATAMVQDLAEDGVENENGNGNGNGLHEGGEGERNGHGADHSGWDSRRVWEDGEVSDFFNAFKEHGEEEWKQVCDKLKHARTEEEVRGFYDLNEEYLKKQDTSAGGLLQAYSAKLNGGRASAEVNGTPAKEKTIAPFVQEGEGGKEGEPVEGNLKAWASSGKRSDRKKRPAQQVRPAVSPEKEKPKAKSPDVLMSNVIETLAQAASVSRSNPGTPQSKLEQNAVGTKAGRGGQSPKPRKRLFADDATAASALLGLATTSNDSSGKPQKKGKGSRASTPKSTPKKQHKSLMDSLRTQPLKELSGLGPQVKPRNRRKPDHRRYLGPLSPLMKLHKRFSAFKGASSPNAKVLERQLKLQSSLDGLLGWGEKIHAPPGTVLNKIQNCLCPSMRRWCYYEWFYSAIDKLWFEKNTFKDFLDHAGIGSKCKTLQRTEWAMIRRSLGKPRRLSLQFLHEERAELEAYRAGVRKQFKEKDPSEIPSDLPRPLIVGQRVTARHPATGQIHDGSILTVDHSNSKYRVQFDRQELGVQQLEDVHIMARTSTETTPLVPIRKPKLEPLNVSEPAMFTPRRQGISAIAEVEPIVSYTPTNQLDSREMDMRSLAQVDHLLDLKQRLLGELKQMNDEAEGNLHLDENGCTSKQFQQNYALQVRNLRECNDRLKSALVRLQQRVSVSQYRLVSQVFVQNPSQQFQSPLLQMQKLSNSDVVQHAKSIVAEAQKIGNAKLKAVKKKGSRGKGQQPKEDEKKVRELISSCVHLMTTLQICADRSLPSEAVSLAVDQILLHLKPKSEKNSALYREIKKSIGIIKTQLHV